MAAKKRSKKRATKRKKACKCPKGWRKAGAKMCKKAKRKMPLACAYPRKKRRGASKRALAKVLPLPAGMSGFVAEYA